MMVFSFLSPFSFTEDEMGEKMSLSPHLRHMRSHSNCVLGCQQKKMNQLNS